MRRTHENKIYAMMSKNTKIEFYRMSEKKGILSRGNNYQAHVKIIAEEKVQNSSPTCPPPSPTSVSHFF